MAGGFCVTSWQEDYETGDSSVISWLSVIQVFVKTLNLCIIKTPESPVPADPYAKSRVLTHLQKSHQSRTAWGPFFERKTRKMSPHGGRLRRELIGI